MEEMEKRSDRHIRDLVAHTAFKGLDANEIGCADIRDGRGQLLPSKGRIQMSKTNYLQAVISDLQRTAGPYKCARCPCEPRDAARSEVRKRRVAQTRFRFLRAAWEASRHSPSGAAMRSARATPPS